MTSNHLALRPSRLRTATAIALLLAASPVIGSLIWRMLWQSLWKPSASIIPIVPVHGAGELLPHEPKRTTSPPAAGPERADHTDPRVTPEGKSDPPVDLTTAAADVPPPPPDHPLMLAYPVRPADISPRTNNPRSISDLMFALSDLEIRLTLLEQGIEPWQQKRRGRW